MLDQCVYFYRYMYTHTHTYICCIELVNRLQLKLCSFWTLKLSVLKKHFRKLCLLFFVIHLKLGSLDTVSSVASKLQGLVWSSGPSIRYVLKSTLELLSLTVNLLVVAESISLKLLWICLHGLQSRKWLQYKDILRS